MIHTDYAGAVRKALLSALGADAYTRAEALRPSANPFSDADAAELGEIHGYRYLKRGSSPPVIALPGVAGLNAAEHLRSLCPACGMIWCSDLDFSLQAFRLRVEYFILEPVSAESFQQGLNVWFANKEFYASDPITNETN